MLAGQGTRASLCPPTRGFPFQAVADGKRGKKWAKWLTQIDLSTDMVFNGYWVSRGYGTAANITLSLQYGTT